MSNKIVYTYDCNNISIRDSMIHAINQLFDKYGSSWIEESEKEGNILEIRLHDDSSDIELILQNKKGSGVI